MTCLFYVAGHTKNVADRWFNTLKRNYRRKNIYTYNQLLKNFQTNPRITVVPYVDGTMKKWRSFCDQFYKTIGDGESIEGGFIGPNHLFVVEEASPTTMVISRSSLVVPEDRTVLNLHKNSKYLDRSIALRAQQGLATIVEPGIPDIVQNELFVKWRPMVEHESRDDICPYPGPGVLQRIKDRNNKKAKEKRDEKKG